MQKKKKAVPFIPTAFVVLMVSNSNYEKATGFHNLPCAATDYTEMRNLFRNFTKRGVVPKGTKFFFAENFGKG